MTDLAKRKGNWIQTYTGSKFWPVDPRPEEINIHDIAHSLSNMCRYAGHCKRFYSVAEHSILVSSKLPDEWKLWGLLHDASEAYLVDVPRPVKPYLGNYYELEERIMEAVCTKFNLFREDSGLPEEVKLVDNGILNDERNQNMVKTNVDNRTWGAGPEPIGVTLSYWSPEVAETRFLLEFEKLYN